MASVRMSESFFDLPLMRDLIKPRRGFRCDSVYIFLRMVIKSANGAEYRNPADIDGLGDRATKQAEYIWNLCIQANALRATPTGRFSLYEWMIENNLIIYDQTKRTRSKRFSHSPTVASSEPMPAPAASFVPPKDALVGEERAKYVSILKDIIGRKK